MGLLLLFLCHDLGCLRWSDPQKPDTVMAIQQNYFGDDTNGY